MIDFNFRATIYLMILAIIAMGGLFIVHHAYAEPINASSFIKESYIIVESPEGAINITAANVTPTSKIPHYLYQGETVYPGDVLDISGAVSSYSQLAYWDGYDMYDTSPSYNITLPERKSGWYNFTLDPIIFGSKLGRWYKYNGIYEQRGNNLAFVVAPRPFYNYTLTFKNGTMIYVSELPDFERLGLIESPKPEIMPVKHIADYLVPSGSPLNITVSNLSAIWIFNGHDNSILYAMNNTASQIVINGTQIDSLESGDYKIIIQSIGNVSKNLDVVFSEKSIKWFDRSAFAVKTIPTDNLVPSEAIRNLETIFPFTYDTYQIQTLSVQDPEITIGYMTQVSVGSAKEFYRDPDRRGNVSLMDVRGYTNVLPGTNISMTLDETHNNPREITKLYTYRSTAQGTYLGDMRYYQIYVPLYWDDLTPGMHTLTARTELGGFVVADFPVSEDTPNSYVPPQTIKFMGDRNPWVPTPTPEIVVKKETVVVTQQVPVSIPPSEDQIRAEAQKIVDEQNKNTEMMIVIGLVVLIALMFIGWFVWSIWRAKRK